MAAVHALHCGRSQRLREWSLRVHDREGGLTSLTHPTTHARLEVAPRRTVREEFAHEIRLDVIVDGRADKFSQGDNPRLGFSGGRRAELEFWAVVDHDRKL